MTRFELVTSSLPRKHSTPELHRQKALLFIWAGDEIRTRDPQLGRLTLYQLSYSRKIRKKWEWLDSNQRYREVTDLQSAAIATMRHSHLYSWSRWRDSNPRPADYKSAALANWATSALNKERFSFVSANICKNFIFQNIALKKLIEIFQFSTQPIILLIFIPKAKQQWQH